MAATPLPSGSTPRYLTPISSHELVQVLAFLSNALWMIGTKIAGDKHRLGWGVLFCSEFLSVVARLWSILPWCAVGVQRSVLAAVD